MEVAIALFIYGLIFGGLGYAIGKSWGGEGFGFLMGLLLGPLGLIIVAIVGIGRADPQAGLSAEDRIALRRAEREEKAERNRAANIQMLKVLAAFAALAGGIALAAYTGADKKHNAARAAAAASASPTPAPSTPPPALDR